MVGPRLPSLEEGGGYQVRKPEYPLSDHKQISPRRPSPLGPRGREQEVEEELDLNENSPLVVKDVNRNEERVSKIQRFFQRQKSLQEGLNVDIINGVTESYISPGGTRGTEQPQAETLRHDSNGNGSPVEGERLTRRRYALRTNGEEIKHSRKDSPPSPGLSRPPRPPGSRKSTGGLLKGVLRKQLSERVLSRHETWHAKSDPPQRSKSMHELPSQRKVQFADTVTSPVPKPARLSLPGNLGMLPEELEMTVYNRPKAPPPGTPKIQMPQPTLAEALLPKVARQDIPPQRSQSLEGVRGTWHAERGSPSVPSIAESVVQKECVEKAVPQLLKLLQGQGPEDEIPEAASALGSLATSLGSIGLAVLASYQAVLLPALINLMHPNKRPLEKEQSASALANIVTAGGEGVVYSLLEMGKGKELEVLKCTAEMLKDTRHPGAQYSAACLLRALCLSPKGRLSAAQANCLGPLVELLRAGKAMAKVAAAGALHNLCFQSPELKHRAVQAGAVEPLVGLLGIALSGATEAALAALRTLAFAESAGPAMLAHGVAPLLVKILHRDSPPEVKTAACQLVQNLATSADQCRSLIGAGVLPPLVRLLQAKQCAAASAVRSLGAFTEEDIVQEMAEAGVISPLVRMLGSGLPEAEVAAASALANVSATGDNAREIALEGGIPTLVALLTKTFKKLPPLPKPLRHPPQKPPREATERTGLLSDSSSEQEVPAPAEEQSASTRRENRSGSLDGPQPSWSVSEFSLLKVAGSSPGVAVPALPRATACLRYFSEALKNLAVDSENRRAIVGWGAMPAFVGLIAFPDRGTARKVVMALYNLAEDEDSLEAMKRLGVVNKLRTWIAEGWHCEKEEYVVRLLRRLER